jgi:hypothetical protein
LINIAPPPRYSTISDNSRMSTSSRGAESPPSANSVLSDSLLMQSGDTLPGDEYDPGTPGTDPGTPGDDPGTPSEDPGSPGDVPGSPGEDPGSPGEDPGSPGEDPGHIITPISQSEIDELVKLPVSESEWQARCIELESALQKFRDQAHNIRKLLRDKVSNNSYFLKMSN